MIRTIKRIAKKIIFPKRKIISNDPYYKDYHDLVSYEDALFYNDSIIGNAQGNKSKITVGDGTHIRGTLLIYPYGGEIVIGKNCYIGDLSRIWSAEKMK